MRRVAAVSVVLSAAAAAVAGCGGFDPASVERAEVEDVVEAAVVLGIGSDDAVERPDFGSPLEGSEVSASCTEAAPASWSCDVRLTGAQRDRATYEVPLEAGEPCFSAVAADPPRVLGQSYTGCFDEDAGDGEGDGGGDEDRRRRRR